MHVDIFANQGLRSSTHTFSSPLVYLMANLKACAKGFDWCTNRDAYTGKTFIKQVTVFVMMKT